MGPVRDKPTQHGEHFHKFHEDTTITYEVMAQARHKLHIFDLQPPSVTLTFDIVMGLVCDTPT